MNMLFDSSAIVAFLVEDHSDHAAVYQAYLKYVEENSKFFISTHSIAEIYRTLTWGVDYLNYSAMQANRIIHSTVLSVFNTIALGDKDYVEVLDFIAKEELTGPIIYDGLIARASQKVEADALVTFNIQDFKRVWSLTDADLIEP